jgi:uncharacterized protein YjiS (DUF1127 family)
VRILDQLHGDPTSPVRATRRERTAGSDTIFSAVDGTSFDEWPVSGATRRHTNRPTRFPAEPDTSRHFAVTWLKAFIIEGLAAYGQSLYPYFVEPGESIDRHELAEGRQYGPRLSHQHWREIYRPPEMRRRFEDHPIAYRHVAMPESWRAGSPTWIVTVTSALVRFCSRMRREQRKWAMIEMLHRLDDRTLKDIGIPRGQIEYAVRHGNQDE